MAREPIRSEPLRDAPRKTRKRKSNVDPFYIPEHLIPDGMSWEWKAETVLGEAQTHHQVGLMENGWEPVEVSQVPGLVPPGATGKFRRNGQVLMARPKYLTDEANEEYLSEAKQRVRTMAQKLSGTPDGHLDRLPAKVSRTHGPISIPD